MQHEYMDKYDTAPPYPQKAHHYKRLGITILPPVQDLDLRKAVLKLNYQNSIEKPEYRYFQEYDTPSPHFPPFARRGAIYRPSSSILLGNLIPIPQSDRPALPGELNFLLVYSW